METIIGLFKDGGYPSISLKLLRNALIISPVIGKPLSDLLFQPLSDQKSFIRKFDNKYWKGALIMPGMAECDDELAIERLQKADIVIFEVHGGGFIIGNCTMYMDSFINWINIFKTKYDLEICIMSIEYGLAPTNKYPKAPKECVAAYNYLTQNLGVSPTKIICSGDSAGATLTLETLVRIYAPDILGDLDAPRSNFGLPLPAGMLLVSPLITADMSFESWAKYGDIDMVSPAACSTVINAYIDPKDGALEDLPFMRIATITRYFDRFLPKHLLVVFGTPETLHDSIVEYFEKVQKDGKVDLTLMEEDLPHDWLMLQQSVGKDKRHFIEKGDERFVDMAVKAVKEAS